MKAATPIIEARLLGPFEMEHARAPIPLGTLGQRALLARLLLDANRTVAVDRLVEDLWGPAVPPSAIKMLHVRVCQLRKALPAGVLITRAPGYTVQLEPEALDLTRFDRLRNQGRVALASGFAAQAAEALRDALRLWRGPALAEFDEPFAVVERRRLEELHMTCTEDLIDAELGLGAHAALVAELDALVAAHPLRERLREQLMLALYRSGRQAQALASYRQYRQLLASELGLQASPALRELELRILEQDAGLFGGPGARLAPTRLAGLGWTGARRPRRGACFA
jgi:DNA-binding SARP family transcriptional activator